MKLGSLCSGAGGLDMAVEQVFGAETVWHCEINDAASKVLALRWPGIPNHRDLTATNWDTVEPVDILTGGYPCQPFSHAGQRKGTDDERHIWPYIREAIRRLRPRVTFLENVAGHRSLGFDRVLGDLAEDGMHVRWTSIRASDVGSCHARERLWILVTDPAGSGPEDRKISGGSAGQHVWPVTRASVGDSSWGTAGGVQRLGRTADELAAVSLLPTPKACDADGGKYNSDGHQDSLPGTVRLLPTPRTSDTNGAGEHGQGGMDLRTAVSLLPTPRASRGAATTETAYALGGTRSDEGDLQGNVILDEIGWGKYGPAIRRWEHLTRVAPAPTEPNKNGNPRLAAAFSEWMMGWPPGWVTDVEGISRNDKLRIIGNGVVPQQAAAALSWLLSLDISEVAA